MRKAERGVWKAKGGKVIESSFAHSASNFRVMKCVRQEAECGRRKAERLLKVPSHIEFLNFEFQSAKGKKWSVEGGR